MGLLAVAGALLAGCNTVNEASVKVAGWITPYKIDIVQGNFVSKEQVDALKPGMSRNQVREILGTPLLSSVFHNDRWDYVFTFKRQGVEPQARKLAVFFRGDALERFEGDEMPTEAEFVAQLEAGRKAGKVPVLEASEESLKKFAPAAKPTDGATPAAEQTSNTSSPLPSPTSYPPLESPSR
jgi:outer membrane protein assembly factor BamE